jgi:amino acid permease
VVPLEPVSSSDLGVLWKLVDLVVWYATAFSHQSCSASGTNSNNQVLGYIIIGSMLLCTVQALGELAVLFPVNGAFFTYIVRFVDPSL